MRKKTINTLADTIFWYILYFLPVISYLLMLLTQVVNVQQTGLISLNSALRAFGFEFNDTNVIYLTLYDLFNTTGVLPLFNNPAFFNIMTWFVSVFIVHLAVDFLLFIPRLAHKYMNKCFQGD